MCDDDGVAVVWADQLIACVVLPTLVNQGNGPAGHDDEEEELG
jgi:hypothetical protein